MWFCSCVDLLARVLHEAMLNESAKGQRAE